MIERQASYADTGAIVAMIEDYYDERGRQYPRSFHECFVQRHLSEPGHVCLTWGDPIQAALLGIVMLHPLTGEMTAFETLWISAPGRSGHGAALLAAFEKWARAQGATRLILTGRTARTGQLLELKGFRPLEMAFDKELI